MSVKISYPFPQYVKLLHSLGFKFVTKEKAWIGYDLELEEVKKQLPEEIKAWTVSFSSFHDSLKRLKAKNPHQIDLIQAQDPRFQEWSSLTIEDSLNNSYSAQEENEERQKILGQFKIDFFHPKIVLGQGGYGLNWDETKLHIKGTLYTYHRIGLTSLFHELSHFITLPSEKVENKNFELKWPSKVETVNGSLNELKVIALTEVLCDFYKVPRPDRDHFFSAIADYPDSQLFFNMHMHLVKVFDNYSEDDVLQDQIAYKFMVEKDKVKPEEAKQIVKKASSEILNRRHKIQVVQAFYEQKLADKYTIDHVRFMFEQQTPFL